MDLLSKSIVASVAIVLFLFIVYFILQNSFTQHVTQAQAVSLVLNDLRNSIPNSVANITNVSQSQYPGSWHIVASVVTNATSPCPSYSIYSFDYPQYSFVYRIENIYTNNCVVYGLTANKSYIIASYPVAIARSYSLNASIVQKFVNKYGYKNVTVKANYYNTTSFLGRNYSKVWIVNYSAAKANYSVYAIITQSNGNLLSSLSNPH